MFYLAVLGGALMAALLALPIGYLSVHRSGIYFAANQWRSLTGGENGLQDIPRSLAGIDLSDAFFYSAGPAAEGTSPAENGDPDSDREQELRSIG